MKSLLTIMLLTAAMLPALSQAQTDGVSVPLMLAPDSERQGFVRIINGTGSNGSVRITAVDDAGNAASPFSIELPAGASVHFNSYDLADGNSAKGIDSIGYPRQGHWRLRVEAAEGVKVMAFVRTGAGFLTAMHDVLPRNGQGRLEAWMLNPGSNRNQESSLRLVNTGTNSERVSIRGVDDGSRSAGPVTLTLPAGQARTITAFDLENGAQGLTGSLGDGGGKWRLTIEAGQSVMGMGLLATPGGPITNISTIGLPPAESGPTGNSFANPFNLAVGGRVSGSIDPAGESDYYRIRVSESGTLTVYTTGNLDTVGYLYDSGESQLARNDDGGANTNFRIRHEVDAGTYYARVRAFSETRTGSYTLHAELEASTEPEPPTGGYYGAYALNDEHGPGPIWVWGYSTDANTQAEADRIALNSCRSELTATGDTCGIEARFGAGQCLVAYVDAQTRVIIATTGVRANLAAMDSRVKARCEQLGRRPCRRIISACNSGTASGTASIAPQTLTPFGFEKR